MYILHAHRITLLGFLPKGGAVAEIGVAEGEFSAHILEQTKPQRLHLIDPWAHQQREDYRLDLNNVAQDEADRRAAAIRDRFAPQMERAQVIVHRDYSTEAVHDFADSSLDWVYVDAMHTYEAALQDLRDWAPKVKEGGVLLGHDYANHPQAREMGFGVVEAVNQFVRETEWRLVFLTQELYPTYLLMREPATPECLAFEAHVLRNVGASVCIPNPESVVLSQRAVQFPDGFFRIYFDIA